MHRGCILDHKSKWGREKVIPTEKGLCCWDCKPILRKQAEMSGVALITVPTALQNKEKLSNQDVRRVTRARELHHRGLDARAMQNS